MSILSIIEKGIAHISGGTLNEVARTAYSLKTSSAATSSSLPKIFS
jgi:hypothetical protein